jgi:hypothetical protein
MMLSFNNAMAYDFSANNNGQTIYYNITSSTNLTIEITKGINNNYSGTVVILSTVNYNTNTCTITNVGHSAFMSCSSLTFVTISNLITSIDVAAFAYSDLTAISISNTVNTLTYTNKSFGYRIGKNLFMVSQKDYGNYALVTNNFYNNK